MKTKKGSTTNVKAVVSQTVFFKVNSFSYFLKEKTVKNIEYCKEHRVENMAEKQGQKTRPIAINRVLRAFSKRPTDRVTDRLIDRPTNRQSSS